MTYTEAFAAAVHQGAVRPPESNLAAAIVADHLATQVAAMMVDREMLFAVEALLDLAERELGMPQRSSR